MEGIIAKIENKHTYKHLTQARLEEFIKELYAEPQPTEYGEGDTDVMNYNFVMYTGTKGAHQMWFVMHCMKILNLVDKSLYSDDRFRRIMNKLYGRQHGKKTFKLWDKFRRHETVRQRAERKAKEIKHREISRRTSKV